MKERFLVGSSTETNKHVHVQFQFQKSQFQILEVCAGNYERKTSGWIKYRDKQKGAINCFSKENIKICTHIQLIVHKNDYKIVFKTQNLT
jgi:hypothetical protein